MVRTIVSLELQNRATCHLNRENEFYDNLLEKVKCTHAEEESEI